MSYKDTLSTLKNSLLLDAAIEAETFEETCLDDVLRSFEVSGTMPSCLMNMRDPLTILLKKEQHGEFHFYTSITR